MYWRLGALQVHSVDMEAREGPTADQVIEWEQSPRS